MPSAAPRPVRFGVVVFPGSNCDTDAHHAIGTFPGATAPARRNSPAVPVDSPVSPERLPGR